ncbi:hypothetical protein [Trichocoleus sp. FACHB-262]|uniref:hypothetical protein n=1 Tax=Trichocoleus sp. FACHB-262 TaxID=2692869 RepID=UPI00168836BB|nr:hypothetical protein [Trichocoleus sp. FACHB-262]MBD2123380.1 hypothetical protein [Trichocoleus sp. FACHB-262]
MQAYAGAQCKRTDALKIEVIEGEVEKAKRFQPCLDEYLIMTTAARDAVLQEQVRTRPWIFRTHIMFWEDISLELSGHDDLLQKHFSGWMKRTTTKEHILNTVLSSQPSDFDYDDVAGTFFYTADVKLQIIKNRELSESEYSFYEPWLDCFADSDATSLPVSIFYGETKILEVLCVYVDSRHIIPLPKSCTNLVIDQLGYHIGCIVNYPLIKTNPTWANFDNALMRAEITVRDD